jgi:hypothetical protein
MINIPEKAFPEIPENKVPESISIIFPHPRRVEIIITEENSIRIIKKDCLKISNLLFFYV